MVWKDLEINRKTTKIYEIGFKKCGVAVDITGWAVYYVVKSNSNDADTLAKIYKKITTHENAKEGITIIKLSLTDTDLEGNYYYSIDAKDNEGNEFVLFSGRVKFNESIIKNRR